MRGIICMYVELTGRGCKQQRREIVPSSVSEEEVSFAVVF